MHSLFNAFYTNKMNTMDTFAKDVTAFWDRIKKNDMAQVAASEPEEDKTAEWDAYFDKANEEEAYQNYMNCKHQIDCNQNLWTLEEMMCFSKYIDDYEKEHSNKLTNTERKV